MRNVRFGNGLVQTVNVQQAGNLCVQPDYQEAARLFQLASDRGETNATNDLGVAYYKGEGVPKDYKEAIRLLRLAADSGNATAQYNLGWAYIDSMGVPQDFSEAAKWYRRAADQNHPIAQIEIGDAYANGHGVPQSWEEAFKWYWRTAKQGNARGQFVLETKLRWKAANGYIPAQYQLGLMYSSGFCVKASKLIAYALYGIAEANCKKNSVYGETCNRASTEKNVLARKMSSTEVNNAEALVRNMSQEWDSLAAINELDPKPPGCRPD